ncbi:MAG: hypothetical protein Q4B04_00805 [bacterium]|nr:hypothetical protein [bacterium]
MDLKKAGLITLSILLAFLASGCVLGRTGELKTLRFGITSNFDSFPIAVAFKAGFFGGNIKIVRYETAKECNKALEDREIDGCVTDIFSSIIKIDRGYDIKITASTNTTYSLVADSKFVSKAELERERIAICRNEQPVVYVYETMLSNVCSNLNTVSFLNSMQCCEMLLNGDVAAAILPEPFASQTLMSGCVRLDSTDNLKLGAIIFYDSVIKNNKTGYKRFISALKRLETLSANENREDILMSAAEYLALPQNCSLYTKCDYSAFELPKVNLIVYANQYLYKNKEIGDIYPYDKVVLEV